VREVLSRHDTLTDFPVVSFEGYRSYCDSNNEFRKIGLQDEAAYQDALNDPTTQFINIDGEQVPILARIKHEKMYHEARCYDMCGCSNIMLLCLPSAALEAVKEGVVVGNDTAVIVEEFAQEDSFDVGPSHSMPELFGEDYDIIDFTNPQLVGTPHETAWMGAYDFTFGSDVGKVRQYKGGNLINEVSDIWHAYALTELDQQPLPQVETENIEGTFILTPEQLAERKDISEALWGISEVGFGEVLGAYHPVSMQFNRDFFDQQIIAPNTLTAVHYADGKPVCFGFISLDMEHNPWINEQSEVIRERVSRAHTQQRPYIHFHELISSGIDGMGYSTNILSTFLNIAKRMNYDFSVFFESTNLSSLYIPKIIEKEIESIDGITLKEDIAMRGKLGYWAFRKNQDSI
jgi:hypothetical protein